MRSPPTIMVGCVVLLVAVVAFIGTTYWIQSRTLRAVDMPISLSRGTINAAFDLNIHGFYSIDIGLSRGGDLICNNGVGLETRRVFSLGGLPVYRYRWIEDESRARGRDTVSGSFLGGFEGKRGHYNLRVEVLSDTGCLDAGNPRLYVIASNDDFSRWNRYYQNAFWISFLSGSIGLGVLIVGIRESLRRRNAENLDSFEAPRSLHGLPALHRVKVAPWVPFFSQIGLLYSQILLLLVLAGILVFHFAWKNDHRSHGLFVAAGLSPMTKKLTCGEVWVVRIDAGENWYLNSTKISHKKLADVLSQQLGGKTNCAVYLDVDPSLSYGVAIEAISTIQKTQAVVVVLLTPGTKKASVR
jgi:Biopolymer transport protein ExbD/TolR